MAVPRIGRALDLVAAALVIIGGAMYARSYVGLEALRARPLQEYRAGIEITRLAEFHALERLSLAGMLAAAAGIGVAVSAAVVARRHARQST